MTGYFIHENYLLDGTITHPGVQKKVLEQIKVLGSEFSVSEVVLDPKPNTLIYKLRKRMPGGSNIYYWNKIMDKIVDPDFIYIRKTLFDYGSHSFLKRIRKKYPKVNILLEIPTYPYDKEILINFKFVPIYLKEVFYRNKLHKYVDRIVTFYTDEKTIFGVPTIRIQNGVSVESHPVRKPKTDKSEIHLIAVASFQKAHGYERIIKGMAEYYKSNGTRRIILDMVGSGDEDELYRNLEKSLDLQDKVVFWGPKYGDELIPMYDMADIGLAPFAFYKHDIDISSALKLREYLARGLPVAAGSKQDIFTEETFRYYVEFSNDDTPVDMNRIVDFYDRIYNTTETYESVIQNIRMYAEDNVTWKKVFVPVIDYLKAEENNK